MGGACVACTEHSQCRGSACHLSGAKKGTCFEPKYVVRASDFTQMFSAVNALAAPGELAVILAAGSFTTTDQLLVKANQEVAIIGESGQPHWGGNGSWSDARNAMVQVNRSGTLYFASIRLQETTPNSTGIGADSGSTLWVDDVFDSGYYTAVSSAASELHIRRSFLRGATSSSLYLYDGTLFMENSVVAPLLNNPSSGSGGIRTYASSIVFDIRYSTIVGGQAAIQCNSAPQPSGSIRNSLLLAFSTTASPIPDACSSVNQSGNYAPTIYYTSAWFTDPDNGNFHLSAGGKAAVQQTAHWSSGDPTTDIDGDARPQSAAGYPGVDQP